jgi:hypothetical protein
MTKMDDFTLSLITNEEVIAVDQNSAANHRLFRQDGLIAWVAEVSNSPDKYLAVFNTRDKPAQQDNAAPDQVVGVKVPVNLANLGFTGQCRIRDLWRKTDVGPAAAGQEFAPEINWHGAGLYRVSAVKP